MEKRREARREKRRKRTRERKGLVADEDRKLGERGFRPRHPRYGYEKEIDVDRLMRQGKEKKWRRG